MSFPNIYAHVPASNKSLLSILTSTYPLISYVSLTDVAPRAGLESISALLRSRGYRTGFFSSGDTRFQRGSEFLVHHGIDTLVSYGNIKCDAKRFLNSSREWRFLDSFDDRCMLNAFSQWDGLTGPAPFFAVLWPVQTHHPYSTVGEPANFEVRGEDFNRYLNALREVDAVFGEMMRQLESLGLAESTLVVIVGDHGEAFGQHNQWIHASALYEENIRVPLLLIHRSLGGPQTVETVGGLIDVAPTILDLLGVPRPGSWQGRSVLEPGRPGRAYFFSPYGDLRFGLRDGDLKLVLNVTANTSEVYDLSSDPYEERNVASVMQESVRTVEQRLAAWVQYQAAFYDRLLAR
jgi:phosphoglycerol transferase MdoB-like AlkP superfamily enzyme